jgi:hypothetical protein
VYEYATILRINHVGRKNPVALLTILQEACPGLTVSDRVCVELRPAVLVVAEHLTDGSQLDWAATHIDCGFYTEDREQLNVHGTRSTFDLKRYTSLGVTCWLLGLYQAEGSKEGSEFSVPNKNPFLLREVADVLVRDFQITRKRLGLRVQYAVDQDPRAVRDRFAAIVGVDVRTVRPRSGSGREVAELYLRDSNTFVGMINAALSWLIDDNGLGRLSSDAARQFAIGFLDGDGSVKRNRRTGSVVLTMSGDERELTAVRNVVEQNFGWSDKRFWGNGDIARSLSMGEVADLIEWGVFRFTMSWPRLLYSLETKTQTVQAIADRFGASPFYNPPELAGPSNILLQWALLDRLPDGRMQLTADALKAVRVMAAHRPDLDQLRAQLGTDDDLVRGRKGVPNPLLAHAASLKAPALDKCYQRLVRERAAREDPRDGLESLAGCRVVPINNTLAAEIILKYEWLGTMGRATACYGLVSDRSTYPNDPNVEGRELLGVACFGRGPGLYGGDVCGDTYRDLAVCLERGACVHWAPKNAASFLIRNAVRQAAHDHGWRIFYAYADPAAGEIGTVYQAANWHYLGQGPGRTSRKRKSRFVRPDGTTVSSRMLHHYGLTRAQAAERGWRAIEVPTKHKYVWFEGPPALRRRLKNICRFPFLAYPKRGA